MILFFLSIKSEKKKEGYRKGLVEREIEDIDEKG